MISIGYSKTRLSKEKWDALIGGVLELICKLHPTDLFCLNINSSVQTGQELKKEKLDTQFQTRLSEI